MDKPIISLSQLASHFNFEYDGLFEKLLGKLGSNRNLILMADKEWGIEEYVRELGFRLQENSPGIHCCFMDMNPVQTTDQFKSYFLQMLKREFPDSIPGIKMDRRESGYMRAPEKVAKMKRLALVIFIANAHLLLRFSQNFRFLRTLNLALKNQINCTYCLYGDRDSKFAELVRFPGAFMGFGQIFELRDISSSQLSVSIRKFFFNNDKRITQSASLKIAHLVDNNPFFTKLLLWHSINRTRHLCIDSTVETALEDLVHHYDQQFRKIVESLTQKQLKYLEAVMNGNRQLHSTKVRSEYKLGSTSNVSRLKQSLETRQIVRSDFGEHNFVDPLFREWLRTCYFER